MQELVGEFIMYETASKPTLEDTKMLDKLDENTYWHPLAADSVDTYFSGEVDNVWVKREDGQWWLSVDGTSGAEPYDTEEEAIIKAVEKVFQSYVEMPQRVAKDLRLSEAEWGDWRLNLDNGEILLSSIQNESIGISRTEGGPWYLYHDDELLGQSRDLHEIIAQAAVVLASDNAPKL